MPRSRRADEATSRNHTAPDIREAAPHLCEPLEDKGAAAPHARAHPHIRQRDKRPMEAGAALDEAMDALAQKNEDLTEDVQTFAKALDGLGEPLSDAKAERRRLETIRAEYQLSLIHI